MILKEYLCQLSQAIQEAGLVNTFHEYCELIQRDGVTYPAYYTSGGEYMLVHDFDSSGNGYIRKRGEVSLQPARAELQMTACSDGSSDMMTLSYPLRLVMGVPKSRLEDDAYSDDRLFYELFEILGTYYPVTDVQDQDIIIRSFDTDALSIWSKEVQGVDYQMLFRLSYISIDFDLTFTVSKACLKQSCGYGY